MTARGGHWDVTGTVRVDRPEAVRDAIVDLLCAQYPNLPPWRLRHATAVFTALYAGTLEGYLGCDTWYHDARHSLDCALAMARLVVAHDRDTPADRQLGPELAELGVICALFHDAGYIRRSDETELPNGAALTLVHVERSADFLARYLPLVGLGAHVHRAWQIVHCTGYEVALDRIGLRGYHDHTLGSLLGSADVLAQCADRCYLEKCRDFLYREFLVCGLAGRPRAGGPRPVYRSREDLLRGTPEYVGELFAERLDGFFAGAYRHLDRLLGGNPYLDAIERHLSHIRRLNRRGDYALLRRRPRRIAAGQLRRRRTLCRGLPRRLDEGLPAA